MSEKRVNNKFDLIVVIDGARGLGKSTLAYKYSSRIKNVKLPFKPKRDIIYSRNEAIKHLANKHQGIIFNDEMVNVTYNRDFYQEEQKQLIKGLNMYRDSCNIFIMCVPSFWDLDVQIRNLCGLRLTMLQRGFALVQMPMKSLYTRDPWDTKNNMRIEAAWQEGGKPRYSQLTTCVGILRFGDLNPRQRIEYEAIKKHKRNSIFGSKYQDNMLLADPEQVFNKNLIEEIKAGKLTPQMFETIATLKGIKSEALRRRVNAALKQNKDSKTYKDYVMSDARKEKRDLLGFKSE